MVKVAPGAMPSFAMRARTGASASRAGLSTSKAQRRAKYVSAGIATTCLGGGVLASIPTLTGTLVGGVYDEPQCDRGVNRY